MEYCSQYICRNVYKKLSQHIHQYTLSGQVIQHLKPTSVLRWALVESRIEICLWDAVEDELQELRAPKFQSSKELRKPNRYKPNRCQWLFNADRVTDRSVVGVLGQQHMINRCHCLSPALLLPLSLSRTSSLIFFLVSFSFLCPGIVRIFTLFVFVRCKFN